MENSRNRVLGGDRLSRSRRSWYPRCIRVYQEIRTYDLERSRKDPLLRRCGATGVGTQSYSYYFQNSLDHIAGI